MQWKWLSNSIKSTVKNKIWLGDITSIPLKEETLYVSVFIDVYKKKRELINDAQFRGFDQAQMEISK